MRSGETPPEPIEPSARGQLGWVPSVPRPDEIFLKAEAYYKRVELSLMTKVDKPNPVWPITHEPWVTVALSPDDARVLGEELLREADRVSKVNAEVDASDPWEVDLKKA
jgi:hypothetical protein